MSMTWEGGMSTTDRRRYEDYVRMKELEQRRLMSYWDDDSYTGIKPKKKKKPKEPEIINPEDLEIDKTYFKMSGDDDGDGENNEDNSGNQGGSGNDGRPQDDTFFEDVANLAEAFSDEEGNIEDVSDETLIQKLKNLDFSRINVKRKFRF